MSEVTRGVRSVVEGAFPEVWVEGEVSNHRQQASWHQYFTLKDADAQLSCVLFARPGMWRRAAALRDGLLVQARGRLTVYEARGQYQLNVAHVQEAGAGALQAKFEALKRRLAEEGLFAPERKRALPQFPAAVGIVTSPTAAALRDMLQILKRRAPWLRIIISPARVQGSGAAAELARALELLQEQPVGVIVLARGGGSMEDLWEFNDEALARAIVRSRIPVVSAVGHEIDFTIADFAADLRAPTPSAAAELIAPESATLRREIGELSARGARAVQAALERAQAALAILGGHAFFRDPRTQVEQLAQHVDLVGEALSRAVREQLVAHSGRLAEISARLRACRPDQLLALRREALVRLATQLEERSRRAVELRRTEVARLEAVLRVLSPESTLRRGYTLTLDSAGKLLRSAAEAAAGTELETRFADGSVRSVVETV